MDYYGKYTSYILKYPFFVAYFQSLVINSIWIDSEKVILALFTQVTK